MGAPVRHTCPDIDYVISKIKSSLSCLKYARETEDESDKNYYINSAEDELYGLDWNLESLRSDNSQLRDWGHDLEAKNEELEKEMEERNNE